ncbi:hypothetical protein [Streptomyces sp. NPDC005568]|uniref:hypothetical protein n=1 Tax=Streptomyces sp. NPDC005568 TaxID=3156887 RepID=UPI0033AA013B
MLKTSKGQKTHGPQLAPGLAQDGTFSELDRCGIRASPRPVPLPANRYDELPFPGAGAG